MGNNLASLSPASSALSSLVLASSALEFKSECCRWQRRLRHLFRNTRKTPTACDLIHLMLYQRGKERNQNCQMKK